MPYQVFHYARSDRYRRFDESAFADRWPTDYRLVATVEAPTLDVVFERTNHLDHDWTTNDGVTAHGTSLRSTSVGDVVVDDAGQAHGVAGVGFTPLPAVPCWYCGTPLTGPSCAPCAAAGLTAADWTTRLSPRTTALFGLPEGSPDAPAD